MISYEGCFTPHEGEVVLLELVWVRWFPGLLGAGLDPVDSIVAQNKSGHICPQSTSVSDPDGKEKTLWAFVRDLSIDIFIRRRGTERSWMGGGEQFQDSGILWLTSSAGLSKLLAGTCQNCL